MLTFSQKFLFFFILLSLPLLSSAHLEGPISKDTSTQPQQEGNTRNKATTPLAQNLKIPWSLDFLPDGTLLFTERAGLVKWFDPKNKNPPEVIHIFADVAHESEGGLLGMAVHPQFSKNNFVYFYHTYRNEKNLLANRVIRMKMKRNKLEDKKIILDNIPGEHHHNGGRIKFGPDAFLYITTGDAQEPSESQDKKSLAGKILRLKDDGTIPQNNPFPNSPVYSFGHRNPQGLAWDKKGKLWATEHGSLAADEVNSIEVGKNYGWPVIRGNSKKIALEPPKLHSGIDTWAPSGTAILDNTLYFVGLRGQSLFSVNLSKKPLKLKRHFHKQFGRLRDIVVGQDKMLYVLTNNTDGRGTPKEDDDHLLKIDPKKL